MLPAPSPLGEGWEGGIINIIDFVHHCRRPWKIICDNLEKKEVVYNGCWLLVGGKRYEVTKKTGISSLLMYFVA